MRRTFHQFLKDHPDIRKMIKNHIPAFNKRWKGWGKIANQFTLWATGYEGDTRRFACTNRGVNKFMIRKWVEKMMSEKHPLVKA